ncbi:MAG TPA: DUF4142 domain-containing protein [Allosphingosinicella sp.]|uniref:DUF4142 domain-containing protein n=1 Tax=Allosphingosinicella sp. TaxID=2823234 RepID=UPI002ED9A766
MKMRILMASAAALALAACGGNNESEGGANITAEDNMIMPADNGSMNASAGAEAGVPQNGQEYATMVGGSDMYEIESSRLAQEKAQRQEIKDLAQMIVTDHEKSTADLKTAAQQAQPAITVTPQMTPEQQANLQALRSANGAQFDQAYLQQQLAAHQKALQIVQGYAQNGDVASLKQHAQTVSGPIQRHLERAQQLQQGGGASQ